jgi:hypothetical protein
LVSLLEGMSSMPFHCALILDLSLLLFLPNDWFFFHFYQETSNESTEYSRKLPLFFFFQFFYPF